MFRTIIFVLMLGLALVLLTGCETTPDSNHGSVSDSVTVHFNCREETKSYRGDPKSEIDMFKRCMERHGYTPDGNPLEKPASTSTSTSTSQDTSSTPTSSSAKQRLQELNDLKANGLITEVEYNKKKAEILQDL